jgi:uncharacterized protein YbjT (DUF2867 family)
VNKILVTGASGNVGREVVKELRRLQQSVVAATVSEVDAGLIPDDGAEIVHFEFGQAETYPAAFNGVRKLFLMRPPAIADVERYLFPVIDYAEQAGVEHIVFLSVIGVNKRMPHYRVEKRLEAGRIPYTSLRPGFYMQNLNTQYRDDIRLRNEIFVPAGRGKTGFIDVRDIGAAAAKVLTENGHTNRAYALTGSEALNYYQVADLLTQVLGRTITYRKPSPQEYGRHMRARGIDEHFLQVLQGLYTPIRWRLGGKVTNEFSQLLGREPIKMQQYIQDYASSWSI